MMHRPIHLYLLFLMKLGLPEDFTIS